MNKYVKNWFGFFFWLGTIYTVMFMGLKLFGAEQDFSTPVGQAAILCFAVTLIGQIINYAMRWFSGRASS